MNISIKDKRTIAAGALCGLFLAASILFMPESAFAADSPFNFGNIIGELQRIVTVLLLPMAIVFSAWKVLYLAIVVGMFGFDPLNYCTGNNNTGDSIDYQTVQEQLKISLVGFFKGLMWIGGIFIIFQLVVVAASAISGVFAEAFG